MDQKQKMPVKESIIAMLYVFRFQIYLSYLLVWFPPPLMHIDVLYISDIGVVK